MVAVRIQTNFTFAFPLIKFSYFTKIYCENKQISSGRKKFRGNFAFWENQDIFVLTLVAVSSKQCRTRNFLGHPGPGPLVSGTDPNFYCFVTSLWKQNSFLLASWRSLTKRGWSGSVSADPDQLFSDSYLNGRDLLHMEQVSRVKKIKLSFAVVRTAPTPPFES